MPSISICFIVAAFLALTAQSELLFANQLVRHGSRYPIHPYYDANESIAYAGQLTGVGVRQHYNLGVYLRRLYVGQSPLLNSTFDPNQVRVYSTNYPRTKESAMAQMAGLFPVGPTIPEELNPSLLYPPFQASSVYTAGDPALPGAFQPIPIQDGSSFLENCQNYLDWEEAMIVNHLNDYGQMNIQYLPFMTIMRKMFNMQQKQLNIMAMSRLYDTLVCDQFIGRKLPDEFTDYDMQNLRHLSHYFFLLIHSDDYMRILSTPLFTKILQDFDAAISGKSPLRLNVMVGHDTNISPTLNFLNISSANCIEDKWKGRPLDAYVNCEDGADFAANLIVELHGPRQNPVVKVRYNGKNVNMCSSAKKQCSYAQWKSRIMAGFVDFQKLCKPSQ